MAREFSAEPAQVYRHHQGPVGEFLARVAPVAARAGDVAVVPTGPWAPSSFAPPLPVPGVAAAGERLARAG